MGYYAGGYYAGGYYAGGFSLGGVFRAVKSAGRVLVGTATGAVGGLLKGGPLGAVKGAITGTVAAVPHAVSQGITEETLAAGDSSSALTPDLIAKHNAAVARGGAGGGTPKPSTALVPQTFGGQPLPPVMGGPTGTALVPMGMGTRGYHVNRSSYVVRGGGTSHYPAGQLTLIPKGTTLARNRRMNWGNGKALARAERRIGAFLHHATKYYRWAHPGKGGHMVPKITKRRKRA